MSGVPAGLPTDGSGLLTEIAYTLLLMVTTVLGGANPLELKDDGKFGD